MILKLNHQKECKEVSIEQKKKKKKEKKKKNINCKKTMGCKAHIIVLGEQWFDQS